MFDVVQRDIYYSERRGKPMPDIDTYDRCKLSYDAYLRKHANQSRFHTKLYNGRVLETTTKQRDCVERVRNWILFFLNWYSQHGVRLDVQGGKRYFLMGDGASSTLFRRNRCVVLS